MTLAGKTLFISGGSRGIGLAIAIRAARDGASVALIAKTAEPDPKLEGTVYTAAAQIEAAGGRALPVVGDIRDETQVARAVTRAAERFGGIDVCVNNASAINLSGTEALEIKRYDLMQSINTRGTFVVSRACIPYLKRSANPHILTLSPPVSLEPRWLAPRVGVQFGLAGPGHRRLAAAVQNLRGGQAAMARARKPELYADARGEPARLQADRRGQGQDVRVRRPLQVRDAGAADHERAAGVDRLHQVIAPDLQRLGTGQV